MLRSEELDLIRYHLGVPTTHIGAEPYITFVAIFDRVIRPFLFDNTTTASTVTSANNVTTITLASNPLAADNSGTLTFNTGTKIVVDFGVFQEVTTIQNLSGLSATAYFMMVHGNNGPYTIYPYGSEFKVRDILNRLEIIEGQLRDIAPTTAGVMKVDEVGLTPSDQGRRASRDKYQMLLMQREGSRNDLGELIGFPNLRRSSGGRSGKVEVY